MPSLLSGPATSYTPLVRVTPHSTKETELRIGTRALQMITAKTQIAGKPVVRTDIYPLHQITGTVPPSTRRGRGGCGGGDFG